MAVFKSYVNEPYYKQLNPHFMRKLCLLLLCCIVLFNASGQAGSLDPTFGNNGIQTLLFLPMPTF